MAYPMKKGGKGKSDGKPFGKGGKMMGGKRRCRKR